LRTEIQACYPPSRCASGKADNADDLRLRWLRFFFYSNEGDPREPAHVHVRKAGAEAKFWLRPEVEIAANAGFDARTLRMLSGVIEARRDEIEGVWHEYFG
jgi:hypothetical protein